MAAVDNILGLATFGIAIGVLGAVIKATTSVAKNTKSSMKGFSWL